MMHVGRMAFMKKEEKIHYIYTAGKGLGSL